MKLFELFSLFEDKAELIAKNQGPKILAAAKHYGEKLSTPEEIINVLKNADPSRNQQYLQWIVNRYIAGEFRLEDVNRIKVDLTSFERHKRNLEKKDINQYKTLGDLYAATDPLDDADRGEQAPISNKQAKKSAYNAKREELISSGQAEIIHKGEEGMLVNPKTEDAAKFFGQGTRWCTAAEENNMFDYYHAEGPIYTWLGSDGFKAQFHLESGQWMNARDEALNDEEMQKLLSIPAIKKLYDDGVIKSEEKLTSDDFDNKYNDRMTDKGYDDWSATKEKIANHVRKHGMSENLISKLSAKNPMLPLFVLPTWGNYPKSPALESYFVTLSKMEKPEGFADEMGPGFYEADMLERICHYMNDTKSWGTTVDEAAFNFIKRLIQLDDKSFVINKYLGETPDNAKIKQYLLTDLPLAAKWVDANDWPELLVAVANVVQDAKTTEEGEDAISLAIEVASNSGGAKAAGWLYNLIKNTKAGQEYEARHRDSEKQHNR